MSTDYPRRRNPGRYLRDTYNPRKGIPSFLIGLVVLAIVVIVVLAIVIRSALSGDVTFTVTDKAVKRDSDNHDQYLIYTDKGTFKDVDSVWFWKFDSSDLYGKLRVGHKYHCDTYGFRFGFTSTYKNLIDCDEVTS